MMQLQDYSRVSSPRSVTWNDKTTVRIACSNELRKNFYTDAGVYLFFIMIVVMPFGLLVMCALFVHSKRKEIQNKCIKPSNHGNIAGVVLTGVFVMLFIICLDAIAVFNIISRRHEYRDHYVQHTINFYVVIITALFDLVAMIYCIMTWFLFVSWTNAYKNGYCQCCPQAKLTSFLRNILKCLFAPYLYLVFGYKKHDKYWEEKRDEDKKIADNIFAIRQTWAILSLLIGPMIGLFTHICYIMVAWLTEPQKTSSVFVFDLVFLVYLFTIFRAVYKSKARQKPGNTTGKHITSYFQSFCQCCIVCCANYDCCEHMTCMDPDSLDLTTDIRNELELLPKEEESDDLEKSNEDDDVIIFSKGKLLSTFLTGIFAMIPLALTILGFIFIPIPALDLADYLRNIIEIGLVLFAALATHRIFSFQEPDLNLLIKKFKEKYKTKKPLSDNLFEACGEIAGEVCHTIYSKQGIPIMENTASLATTSNGLPSDIQIMESV